MKPSNGKTETGQFLDSYKDILDSFVLPDRISGQYVLLSCIKHSGNKEIYLLSDKQKNSYILKREKNSSTARIRQEYEIFGILKETDESPSMPECIDYWEELDWCYLLRTYIEGDSLAEYFDRHPFLSGQETACLFLEICRLIKILHDRNPPIIHRDIKPENFVLQKGTHVLYLIDFDTARQYIPEKARDTQLFGTPELAAPEQFGFHQSDMRTDIYGIGKTMLYLITGSTAEEGLQDKSIPSGLRKIIRRAAAFSPEKRYSSIAALQKDLQKYIKHLSFAVPLYRIAAGMALFLLGIGIGFIGGKHYQAQPSGKTGTAVSQSGTSLPEQTAAQLEKSQNSSDSLLSISGAEQVDLWKYQSQVDAIILSYYNTDYDTMTAQLEALVRDLYSDDAIMQHQAEDYSTYEALPPNFWEMNELSTIRVRLAYRNQILQTRLGTYMDYQKNIIDMLDNSLSLISRDETPSCLYLYATVTSKKRDDYYKYALTDILSDVYSGFDAADGFIPPI